MVASLHCNYSVNVMSLHCFLIIVILTLLLIISAKWNCPQRNYGIIKPKISSKCEDIIKIMERKYL